MNDNGVDAIADKRAQWRAAGIYATESLGQVMDAVAREHAGDVFVFFTQDGEHTVTLGEITTAAYQLAGALRRRGVGGGDVVAVQLPDGVECVVAYRAAIALGVTLVPIPAIYGEKEVAFILADSGARCLVTADRWRSSEYVSALPRVLERTSVELTVVVGAEVPDGCLSWSELSADRQPGDDRPPESGVTAAHEAAILYTSGSTADPKGVRHSHETLLYELRQCMPPWRLHGARWLSVLPFAHMAGFLTVCRPLLFGGGMVSVDRWDPVQALELLKRFDITSGTLPPYHLTTLLEAARAEGVDRLELRDVLVGSTAVQAALIRSADAVGCRAYRCYGSSEHPTISSGEEHDPLDLRADTDGKLYPDMLVRIVDEDDNDVPPGTPGEILSTGPDLFLGYTDPAATAAVFTADGYYRTGDIGILDGDRLTITGRRKELIIRGGENLSPKEIEDVLGTHAAVVEVAVVGAPDPRYGERAWAFVLTRDGLGLTLEEVREHFRAAGIARQKTPEGITVLDEFPRTAAGKIRKTELRKLLA
ncbi:MAG TPA: AMP-binding protein [Amycolatopsis sp.]|nr:AMP-binding protein [Amycolatopsis sp.]